MSYSQIYRANGSDIVKHVFDWVSDSGGAAVVASDFPISGAIARVVFKPDATLAPTADYDVTLTDEYGIDILAGQGANLHTSNASHVCPGVPLKDGTTTSVLLTIVDSILTLTVANAGNAKAGKVVVFVR